MRLEFFGDQVESVRRFDPFTQESVSKADEAVLAAGGGGLAAAVLWQQLPPGPVLVLGELPGDRQEPQVAAAAFAWLSLSGYTLFSKSLLGGATAGRSLSPGRCYAEADSGH